MVLNDQLVFGEESLRTHWAHRVLNVRYLARLLKTLLPGLEKGHAYIPNFRLAAWPCPLERDDHRATHGMEVAELRAVVQQAPVEFVGVALLFNLRHGARVSAVLTTGGT